MDTPVELAVAGDPPNPPGHHDTSPARLPQPRCDHRYGLLTLFPLSILSILYIIQILLPIGMYRSDIWSRLPSGVIARSGTVPTRTVSCYIARVNAIIQECVCILPRSLHPFLISLNSYPHYCTPSLPFQLLNHATDSNPAMSMPVFLDKDRPLLTGILKGPRT